MDQANLKVVVTTQKDLKAQLKAGKTVDQLDVTGFQFQRRGNPLVAQLRYYTDDKKPYILALALLAKDQKRAQFFAAAIAMVAKNTASEKYACRDTDVLAALGQETDAVVQEKSLVVLPLVESIAVVDETTDTPVAMIIRRKPEAPSIMGKFIANAVSCLRYYNPVRMYYRGLNEEMAKRQGDFDTKVQQYRKDKKIGPKIAVPLANIPFCVRPLTVADKLIHGFRGIAKSLVDKKYREGHVPRAENDVRIPSTEIIRLSPSMV
jgi:hypothetical protein